MGIPTEGSNPSCSTMKAMVTGHRPGYKLNEREALSGMEELLLRLWHETEDEVTVITGGADGVDRLWARTAMRLQTPFHLYVPRGYYKNYKLNGWPDRLIEAAEEVHWTQPEGVGFQPKFNHERNIQMVDAADIHVVCSYMAPELLIKKDKKGGTRHCANEILKRKLDPIWINSLIRRVRIPTDYFVVKTRVEEDGSNQRQAIQLGLDLGHQRPPSG